MKKFNICDIVRVISGDKYLEMYGLVTNSKGDEEYIINIIGIPNAESVKFNENDLEMVSIDRPYLLRDINQLIQESKEEHPGLGQIIFEDVIEYGYVVNDVEFYVSEYLTENVSNGLPPWRGNVYSYFQYERMTDLEKQQEAEKHRNDTIPVYLMSHIIERHALRERIGKVLITFEDDILNDLKWTEDKLDKIVGHIRSKLEYINGARNNLHPPFTDQELSFIKLAQYYDRHVRKEKPADHYPYDMSDIKIMNTIKEAYGNAKKVSGRHKIKDEDEKKRPIERETITYQGTSKDGLEIQFFYDFIRKEISSAWPVYIDMKNKPKIGKRKSG